MILIPRLDLARIFQTNTVLKPTLYAKIYFYILQESEIRLTLLLKYA